MYFSYSKRLKNINLFFFRPTFYFFFLFKAFSNLKSYWSYYYKLFVYKLVSQSLVGVQSYFRAYYSSLSTNQRFFFFFDSFNKNFFLSVGIVLKQLNVLSKGYRSTVKGFVLFIKATQLVMNMYNFEKNHRNFYFSDLFFVLFFSGFSKKFFFFVNKFLVTSFFFGLSTSFFVFIPKVSFVFKKIKKYKAIKRSYRKHFITLESTMSV